MKTIIYTLLLFFISVTSFGQLNMEDKITQLLNVELEKENIQSASLQVFSRSKDINLSLARGTFKSGKPASIKNPFYLASITKTFTATAIGILEDENKLLFDDKINLYLKDDILKDLHILNGVDYSYEITISQLLQHTSGLPDYFEDTTSNGTPNMMTQLFISPTKTWTPTELIEFSKQNMKPLFYPGTNYHYTDTEYVLLGLIIEQVSGLELHDFFKQYIFEPLHMKHTYMNLRSQPILKTEKMAEIYANDTELSNFISLSADWGGGGLVATTEDLIKFQEALFNAKLVTDETLKTMQQWVPETKGMYYGFGLRKIILNEVHPSLPKLEIIGHSGSTGSFLYYCPTLDTYITGTLNQTEATKSSIVLISNVMDVILKNI